MSMSNAQKLDIPREFSIRKNSINIINFSRV